MGTEVQKYTPQADIPTDVIIHHIVKDYRRMFNTFQEMKERAEKAEAMVEDLKEKHRKQLERKEREIKNLKEETVPMEVYKELKELFLEEQRRNRSLARSTIIQTFKDDPQKFYREMGISVDPEEIEKKMGIQLGDAMLKLNIVEELLTNISQSLENSDDSETAKIAMSYRNRITRAMSKIDAAKNHGSPRSIIPLFSTSVTFSQRTSVMTSSDLWQRPSMITTEGTTTNKKRGRYASFSLV